MSSRRRRKPVEVYTDSNETRPKVSKPQETSESVITNAKNAENRKLRKEFEFYDQPCLDLAKKLLGQNLVRRLADGTILSGMIVETEGYLGSEDSSAHSYSGQTLRNKAMFMAPGTAYVYNIYGSYCCMNISSRGELWIYFL
jgi:hypothetical protein